MYIEENPEIIPIYDIDPTLRLMILKREFNTMSGPIDVLAVDNTGSIYIIETKLFKNPDKRQVIAQVLDYGAMLTDSYRDFSEFLSNISQDVLANLMKSFSLEEQEAQRILDVVKSNLYDGNFKFVILMDHLDERLKRLILYLNRKSDFDTYAVEIENYIWDEKEIVIPRLFGTNVRKVFSSPTGVKDILADEAILENYKDTEIYFQMQEYLRLFNEISQERLPGLEAYKTPRYLYISVNETFSMNVHISPSSEKQKISFWIENVDSMPVVLKSLKTNPSIQITKNEATKVWEKIAEMPIAKFSYDEMLTIITKFAKPQ